MPYELTEEDRARLEKEQARLVEATLRVAKMLQQEHDLHVAVPAANLLVRHSCDYLMTACPWLSQIPEALVENLGEAMEVLVRSSFYLGQEFGDVDLLRVPCANNGDGHQHEAEAIVEEAARKIREEGTGFRIRVVEPNGDTREEWIDGDLLEGLQKLIGGYVEQVRIKRDDVDATLVFGIDMPPEGTVMLVDEDGLSKGLPPNGVGSILYGMLSHGGEVFGRMILIGTKTGPEGEEWAPYEGV
jgi:hypothetical protein